MKWNLHIGLKLRSLEPPEVLNQIWPDLVKKLKPPERPLWEGRRFFQWWEGMSLGILKRFWEKKVNLFFWLCSLCPRFQRPHPLVSHYFQIVIVHDPLQLYILSDRSWRLLRMIKSFKCFDLTFKTSLLLSCGKYRQVPPEIQVIYFIFWWIRLKFWYVFHNSYRSVYFWYG